MLTMAQFVCEKVRGCCSEPKLAVPRWLGVQVQLPVERETLSADSWCNYCYNATLKKRNTIIIHIFYFSHISLASLCSEMSETIGQILYH